jgi:hypothetical protein
MKASKEEQIAKGDRPEKTEYDQMRWDSMKLRKNGMYGQPKLMPVETIFPGTCELCIFGSGNHSQDCIRNYSTCLS